MRSCASMFCAKVAEADASRQSTAQPKRDTVCEYCFDRPYTGVYIYATVQCSESSIVRKLITNTLQALLHPRQHRRGVATLLLLLVTYSVTAELVHRHGQPLPARAATVASFDNTQAADSAAKGSLSGDVCLLCQFQQQLAHGLVQVPPFTFRLLTSTTAVVVIESFYLPVIKALPCGRAPPLASLF